MTALVRYEAMRAAVEAAHSVDEVMELREQAEQLRAAARIANDLQVLEWATEIRHRAVRKIGELMQGQRKAGLMDVGGRPRKTGSIVDPVSKAITLAEAGIDKHLADKARKFAAIPEFELFLEKAKQKISDGVEGRRQNLTGHSGGNEWFTPQEYIERARAVMGEIDLDPASHRVAQDTVRAKEFFTPDDDGLSRPWHGRVWLNPPYAQPLIRDFIDKLIAELSAGRVTEAILLVNNASDTAWFHEAGTRADRVLFTRGRVRFVALDGMVGSPTQGQTLFYFGRNAQRFADEFSALGLIYGGAL